MKQFDVPVFYRSALVGKLKQWRRQHDPRKKDFTPSLVKVGPVEFVIPRHMGFCYGVENAIEISYRALEENPGKRIFLLSQMIHNPAVNADLEARGIQFLMDTEGRQLIPLSEVQQGDVVITPAFGTTVEIEHLLAGKGVELETYNTTCPFVEKVWKRSAEIGGNGFTVIIHGKYLHEETRATFSHSYQNAPSIVIRDMKEARDLARAIRGELSSVEFDALFAGRYSAGFDPGRDLQRVGVVNQTTMLATETQDIADYIKSEIVALHGSSAFADTRDTLCYATNDNQQSTLAALDSGAHLALVIGGFNSSNTAQLATILSKAMPVYYIRGWGDVGGIERIRHFDYQNKCELETKRWLPEDRPLRVVVTSGASCPDSVVEEVLLGMCQLLGVEEALKPTLERLVSE